MAENTTSTTTDEVEGAATEPTSADALAELQAKYDALLVSSRKWEDRSKANAEKAKQYDALAQQTADAQAAADKAAERAAQAEAELAAANRQLAVSRIAADKGVDAEILAAMSAEDEEGIVANADKLEDAMEKNGDGSGRFIHFVNREDAATYRGTAPITTQSANGLIGVSHAPAYDHVSTETNVLTGMLLFPEVKDYIIKTTISKPELPPCAGAFLNI